MMASGDKKYPFFQKLRTVAAAVSNDVKEIEKKMRSSKFELPENQAMFKLIDLNDEMSTLKQDSHAYLQKLVGENQKYARYSQDIEGLIIEMERNTERVEDFLVGYGYKKWHPQCMSMDESDQLQPATPLKEVHQSTVKAAELMKQQSLQKTPVLADYGLTSKTPKYLPSALKDKQESAVKSAKKQVHFESPERQPEKEKENRVPYSLQKTPLLSDYGLPSRKGNQCFLEVSQEKDPLCIKKHLNFRSPLGSISGNATQSNVTGLLALAEVDSSENFNELVNSLPSGLNASPAFRITKAENDESSTPEEPAITPLRYTYKESPGTPEEPAITPLTYTHKGSPGTPEEPATTPLILTFEDAKSNTPKTPEFQDTSSFQHWLRSQKR